MEMELPSTLEALPPTIEQELARAPDDPAPMTPDQLIAEKENLEQPPQADPDPDLQKKQLQQRAIAQLEQALARAPDDPTLMTEDELNAWAHENYLTSMDALERTLQADAEDYRQQLEREHAERFGPEPTEAFEEEPQLEQAPPRAPDDPTSMTTDELLAWEKEKYLSSPDALERTLQADVENYRRQLEREQAEREGPEATEAFEEEQWQKRAIAQLELEQTLLANLRELNSHLTVRGLSGDENVSGRVMDWEPICVGEKVYSAVLNKDDGELLITSARPEVYERTRGRRVDLQVEDGVVGAKIYPTLVEFQRSRPEFEFEMLGAVTQKVEATGKHVELDEGRFYVFEKQRSKKLILVPDVKPIRELEPGAKARLKLGERGVVVRGPERDLSR
jgi:hypothetical protein